MLGQRNENCTYLTPFRNNQTWFKRIFVIFYYPHPHLLLWSPFFLQHLPFHVPTNETVYHSGPCPLSLLGLCTSYFLCKTLLPILPNFAFPWGLPQHPGLIAQSTVIPSVMASSVDHHSVEHLLE